MSKQKNSEIHVALFGANTFIGDDIAIINPKDESKEKDFIQALSDRQEDAASEKEVAEKYGTNNNLYNVCGDKESATNNPSRHINGKYHYREDETYCQEQPIEIPAAFSL